MDTKDINKKFVDAKFQQLASVMTATRLGHEIRAIEDLVSLARNESYNRDTEKGLEPDMPRPFVIRTRVNTRNRGVNATAFAYDNGANLMYTDMSNLLAALSVIGHELGHIYLGHVNNMGPRNTAFVKDDISEAQATYFARLVIERRAELYKNESFVEERKFPKHDIKETLKKCCAGADLAYDENCT